MVTIKNESVCAQFAELGAELRRITVDGKEQLWSGDPSVWANVAPIMFPICGGLKDDKFIFEGKPYTLTKHGFAKLMEFEVEAKSENAVTFLLKSNEDTLKKFPWEFEFRVKYSLSGKRLRVDFDVKNLSSKTMYMSVGSHEAYACPEGIEEYDVIFERKETLKAIPLNGNLLERDSETLLFDSNTFPLYEKYFDIDALVFADVKSRFVTLRNRRNGRSVSISFPGKDYLLLWHKPNSKYICIEPWSGLPSFMDSTYNIEEKEGITAVPAKESFAFTHEIYF